MSDALRCSELEGRRVYRARRPSRRLGSGAPPATADAAASASSEAEETVDYGKVGKVRACLFHPKKRRFVGLLVRRPDALWMFHRKDLFVARGDFQLADKAIFIESGAARDAKPSLKLDDEELRLADCVIWTGLDVVTTDDVRLGFVGDVAFDAESGVVESLSISEGSASQALLGRKNVPAQLISGFSRGVGSDLVDDSGRAMPGAIVVDEAAMTLANEGGIAESAGKAVAVATHKASHAINEVKPKAKTAVANFKERYIDVEDETEGDDGKTDDEKTDDAFERGAQAVGRQLKRASGMFGDFLDEYRKARDDQS